MRGLKKFVFGSVFCFCFFPVTGQNLVSNSGFEDYNQCPTTPYFDYLKDWFIISWTPDFYNMNCGGPTNGTGYQLPHNGQGYIGFHELEKFGTKLTEPLVAGKTYSVSMFISMRDMNHVPGDFINVHFSADSICSEVVLDDFPTVKLVNAMGLINDTMNWVQVSALYVASGFERFIAISMQNESYYYVDDVEISCADPSGCSSLTTDYHEVQIPNVFTPSQDGINDHFKLRWDINPSLIPQQEFKVVIINRWGSIVAEFTDPLFEWDGKWNGMDLPEGVYFCHLNLNRGPCNESISLNGFVHLIR